MTPDSRDRTYSIKNVGSGLYLGFVPFSVKLVPVSAVEIPHPWHFPIKKPYVIQYVISHTPKVTYSDFLSEFAHLTAVKLDTNLTQIVLML
jgi:hypothetical protein